VTTDNAHSTYSRMSASSSTRKKRLRVLEDSEEEEAELGPKVRGFHSTTSHSTPQAKPVQHKKLAPSSATSEPTDSGQSMFRRVPRESMREKAKIGRPTVRQNSQKQVISKNNNKKPTSDFRSRSCLASPSSSSSESYDSDVSIPKSLRKRLNDRQSFSFEKEKSTTSNTIDMLDDSTDSDGDSFVNGKIFTTANNNLQNQQPMVTRHQIQQRKTVAQRNQEHGIDPSLCVQLDNSEDSDSDGSVLISPGLKIVTTSSGKTKKLDRKRSPFKGNSQQARRKPPAQPIQRHPPVQPKRKRAVKSKKNHQHSDSENDISSSDESSNLRRMTAKCTRQEPDQQQKEASLSVTSHNYFDMTDEACNNDDDISTTGSTGTVELLERIATNFHPDVAAAAIASSGSTFEASSPAVIVTTNTTTPFRTAAVAIKNVTTCTGGSDDSDENYSNPFTHTATAKTEAETDDDSVDTVELNRRIRLNLGLPVHEVEEKDRTSLQAEMWKTAQQSPMNEQHFDDASTTMDYPYGVTTQKQQPRQEGDFVLPACDSSSSSDDDSNDDESGRLKKACNLLQSNRTDFASGIGVQVRKTAQKADVSRQRNNKNEEKCQPQALNPYARRAAANSRGIITVRTSTAMPSDSQKKTSNPYSRDYIASKPPAAAPSPVARTSCQSQSFKQRQEDPEPPPQYCNESPTREDFDDIFFSSEPSPPQQNICKSTTSSSRYSNNIPSPHPLEEPPVKDLATAFFNTKQPLNQDPLPAPSTAASHRAPDIVDLCQDDEEEDGESLFVTNPSSRNVHQGLRMLPASPGFNRRAREFGNGRKSYSNNNGSISTDEINYFSDSGDRVGGNRSRPRRVTDITHNYHPSRPVNKLQATVSSTHYDPTAVARLPSTRPENGILRSNNDLRQQLPFSRPSLPQEWTEQPTRQRRIRDASNSNPFMARSVVRKPQNSTQQKNAPILPTTNEHVFYRQNAQPAPSSFFHQTSMRNDLAGGSGVGAGNYALNYGRGGNYEDDIDQYEDDGPTVPRTSTRGRRKSAACRAKSPRRKSGKTGTKHGKGKSKGGWGHGKRGSWGGKRGGRGGGRSSYNRGSVMESQSDAFLANVGGASITF